MGRALLMALNWSKLWCSPIRNCDHQMSSLWHFPFQCYFSHLFLLFFFCCVVCQEFRCQPSENWQSSLTTGSIPQLLCSFDHINPPPPSTGVVDVQHFQCCKESSMLTWQLILTFSSVSPQGPLSSRSSTVASESVLSQCINACKILLTHHDEFIIKPVRSSEHF